MTVNEDLPWVEKFRPSTLHQVSGQEETIEILSKTIQSNNLPHLLFYGVPGSGKTSTILAMAKDLFGDLYKQRVLELNASDERGIEVIRTKVKNFAQVSVSGKGPSFKLIILDEADSMTADAQAALRRTMETWSHLTRFCLICNYLTRIIEPLASRCAKFRFKPLPSKLMVERLEYITKQEGMDCQRQTLDALVKVSDGDMRQAITLLQTAKRLCVSDKVTPNDIYEMTGTIPDNVVNGLFRAWEEGSFDDVQKQLGLVFREGYSGLQLLSQIHARVVDGSSLGKSAKQKMAIAIGKVEKRLIDGADEELQILQLLTVK